MRFWNRTATNTTSGGDPPARHTQWALVPRTTIPTRIYTAATFVLYATATVVLAAAALDVATVSPGPGNAFSADTWAVTSGMVAVSLAMALFNRSYRVFRIAATLTAMWASAYEVNLIFILLQQHRIAVGVVLWGWVVVIQLLFTRYRLILWTATTVTPDLLPGNTANKARQLQQLTGAALPVPPRGMPRRRWRVAKDAPTIQRSADPPSAVTNQTE